MEEKQIWSEVNKIIKRCERKRKRHEATARKRGTAEEALPAPSTGSARQKKYNVFMLAVEDIMKREHEVNMDITLRGDMARAFHITMAIGRYLWNKDEDAMVGQIMQAGVEQIINEYNSEVVIKEAKKVFKPMLKELLREMEDEEL
ncbi:MAG: hypothetical protein FJX76_01285 [Armatimonadetes bacterium]|nr:hypothetical protein [Armatimonadota bacterium]